MKKRIAFILGGMGRGGAERVISILSNHYIQNGWEVDILMLLNNRVEYELHSNITLIDLSNEKKSRLRMLPYWLKSIRSYIKKTKPTVLVSFAARISIICLFAKMFIKVPIIISERNDPKADTRGRFAKMLIPLLYTKADKIIFQTEYAKSCFNIKIQALGVIIYNPVNIMCFAQEEKQNKIVNIGRLDPQKNQKLLISAFKGVLEQYPDYKLEIYGSGILKGELIRYIGELNINNNVSLEGNVLDLHERIKDAKIMVLSSDFEGLSNALLEAMMMGLPCISTTCAGATEIINDGNNGLLVPVGDKESMTKAMLKLIENKELALSLGNEAKNVAKLVSQENVIGKWDDVILKVISK